MSSFDWQKFELVHQVGGIRTGRLDWPDAGGSPGCRVAMVNTGSGLRYTIALDRGGDIVEAFYQERSLTYLTPNGYQPPSHSLQLTDDQWLESWPAGLMTSCGPRYIGHGRDEDGQQLYLHGPHSNTPAALLAISNPDPQQGELDFHLDMTIRDTRMYGPSMEVRRRISGTLGEPVIRIADQVVNLGNTRVAHNWMYHVNYGYPLVDRETQIVLGGKVTDVWDGLDPPATPPAGADLNAWKIVPDNLPEHAGTGSRGLILDVAGDQQGTARIGMVNSARAFGVEMRYDSGQLPRLANWQHYGPGGSYVCALEPFRGSLVGKQCDAHPQAASWLEPGQSQNYQLEIFVRAGDELQELLACDQSLVASPA